MARRIAPRLLMTLALACAGVALPGPAQARTIRVTTTHDNIADDGKCSLREALRAANENVEFNGCPAGIPDDDGQDVIAIPAGTYSLKRLPTGDDEGLSGDLDVYSYVELQGAGARRTTIRIEESDTFSDGVFDIHADSGARLFFLSIKDGLRGIRVAENAHAFLWRSAVIANDAGLVVGHDASASLRDSVVARNRGDGGVSVSHTGTVYITSSTITRNRSSDSGGGISLSASGVDVPTVGIGNSTISGNRAQQGGGIHNSGGDLILRSVTLTDNLAIDGAGLYTEGTEPSERTRVGKTIISGNYSIDKAEQRNCDLGIDGLESEGYNLEYPTDSCNFDDPTDVHADPALQALRDNGGPTPTHAISRGSAARNAVGTGTPRLGIQTHQLCHEDDSDQRGAPRTDCDIGAYELVFCSNRPVNEVGDIGRNRMIGDSGRDVFLGLGGWDVIKGRGGGDAACGGHSYDRLVGGHGHDNLFGGVGPAGDVLKGGPGDDTLFGGAGGDVLKGGPGDDTCLGGRGRDTLTSC